MAPRVPDSTENLLEQVATIKALLIDVNTCARRDCTRVGCRRNSLVVDHLPQLSTLIGQSLAQEVRVPA
jgi:hypothetical protein